MKDTGNLEGILLTGLTKDGVELMETYVDRTGDVQTASFCMLKVCRLPRARSQRSLKNVNSASVEAETASIRANLSEQASSGDVLKDPRVQCWIENYRNLLDAWRFWHKRAEFDIHRGKLDPSSKPLAQVMLWAAWLINQSFFDIFRL